MSSETIVGLCANKHEHEKDKPWVAVRRAAPLAICLVALPALLLTLVGMPSTSRLHWTTHGTVRVRFGEKCDVSTGRWLSEPRGPIYTNLTCSTIPDSKNCQKFGKDYGHLYWRWQPDGCELPRFAPASFLDLVRGKRLAFIGDSLARNQMESLLCLLSQAEAPTDVYADASDNAQTWHFPAHNFTVMALTTRFFAHASAAVDADRKPTDSFDIHLDRLDAVWRSHLPELDYAVLSGGNWFFRVNYFLEEGRRIGCAGCRGAASNLTDLGITGGVRRVVRASLEAVARCRDCKPGLVTLLRTYTPSHFEHGSWFDGGYCNRTRPSEEGEIAMEGVGWELRRVQREEVRRAREASGGKRFFGVMDVTKAMMMRPDGHPNSHSGERKIGNDKGKISNDCLHWCLPGPVDMWNEVLLQQLAEISPPVLVR